MLRLRATLVAMAAARLRAGGWSAARGVDFALPPATTQGFPSRPDLERTLTAEPPSFLDPEDDAPPGTVLRTFVSLAAARVEAAAPVASGAMRAWARLPVRASRT